jgi:RNA exonuclease 4
VGAPTKPWHPGSSAVISSNWQALQQQLKAAAATAKPQFRRKRKDTDGDAEAAAAAGAKGPKKQISSMGRNTALTSVVAMDCEMVGVGPQADRDSLARVSIVSATKL